VYFLDTDRIARDVAYQTIILGELLKHGKQIIIKGRDYVNNPENKFTVTVLGAVAELERAKIIERTTRGRLHRLRMGELSSNGHRIYGYDYVRKTAAAPAALVINKKSGLKIEDMVRSRWVYRKLRNFRAGIEAGISCLKRVYGLARCTWRGLDHFRAYVWSAVVAYNLALVARLKPT
jgi:transposase, IS5 family